VLSGVAHRRPGPNGDRQQGLVRTPVSGPDPASPVPAQVSVVGFDDGSDASADLPPLTTVHQDFAGPGTDLVPTRLVVRAGTASPP
jgi:hypothetical protein